MQKRRKLHKRKRKLVARKTPARCIVKCMTCGVYHAWGRHKVWIGDNKNKSVVFGPKKPYKGLTYYSHVTIFSGGAIETNRRRH